MIVKAFFTIFVGPMLVLSLPVSQNRSTNVITFDNSGIPVTNLENTPDVSKVINNTLENDVSKNLTSELLNDRRYRRQIQVDTAELFDAQEDVTTESEELLITENYENNASTEGGIEWSTVTSEWTTETAEVDQGFTTISDYEPTEDTVDVHTESYFVDQEFTTVSNNQLLIEETTEVNSSEDAQELTATYDNDASTEEGIEWSIVTTEGSTETTEAAQGFTTISNDYVSTEAAVEISTESHVGEQELTTVSTNQHSIEEASEVPIFEDDEEAGFTEIYDIYNEIKEIEQSAEDYEFSHLLDQLIHQMETVVTQATSYISSDLKAMEEVVTTISEIDLSKNATTKISSGCEEYQQYRADFGGIFTDDMTEVNSGCGGQETTTMFNEDFITFRNSFDEIITMSALDKLMETETTTNHEDPTTVPITTESITVKETTTDIITTFTPDLIGKTEQTTEISTEDGLTTAGTTISSINTTETVNVVPTTEILTTKESAVIQTTPIPDVEIKEKETTQTAETATTIGNSSFVQNLQKVKEIYLTKNDHVKDIHPVGQVEPVEKVSVAEAPKIKSTIIINNLEKSKLWVPKQQTVSPNTVHTINYIESSTPGVWSLKIDSSINHKKNNSEPYWVYVPLEKIERYENMAKNIRKTLTKFRKYLDQQTDNDDTPRVVSNIGQQMDDIGKSMEQVRNQVKMFRRLVGQMNNKKVQRSFRNHANHNEKPKWL